MQRKTGSVFALACLATLTWGCGGGDDAPAADGSVTDGAFADGGASDAGDVSDGGLDGSTVPDAGPATDGGSTGDAGMLTDGGLDGSPALDGGGTDAGGTDAGPGLACNTCHGDSTSNAPPRGTDGATMTSARGVGAHRSHLVATPDWHREVVCTDCHVVPTHYLDPGHMDTALPAELTWGTLAASDGASPGFDGVSCSGVYCHGETLLSGGTNTTPTWTTVDGTEAACGTCHGLPPDAPHVQSENCYACHPTIDSARLFPTPALHINGIVEISLPSDCTTCHGSGTEPAPPQDTLGNTTTASRGVGAHRSHLGTSPWRAPIACGDCHIVPAALFDAGHIDTLLPAELTWGPLARTDGTVPTFDGTTCADVYCHGTTLLPGGSLTVPEWTRVDGTQAACGTCHSLPPGGTHTTSTACSSCHPTIDASMTIIDPDRHIDGIVDVMATSCTSCHGSGTNPAPPVDVAGGSGTGRRGVGAHRRHLRSSTWRAPITCDECHVVPSAVGSVGHIDASRPADLTWGPTATADGATPSFDGTRCSDAYCHGETLLPGGTITRPVWTTVDGTQAACGTCHSLPPGGTHTGITSCESCHGAVIDAAGTIIAPALHVDGTVQSTTLHPAGWAAPTAHGSTVNNTGFTSCQACHGSLLDGGLAGVSCSSCHPGWETNCTFCHGGTLNTTGAPPEGIDGETARINLAVGAHTEHVADTSMHIGRDCTMCHVKPVSIFSAGHIDGDGRAEVTFVDPLNPAAAYNYGTAVCSSLYCHGNGSSTLGTGDWDTNPTLDCGSCHAPFTGWTETELRAMSGEHNKHVRGEGYSCDRCHGASVSSGGAILRIDLHVNGLIEVDVPSFDPTDCGGRGGCNPSCHGGECWN